MAYETEDHEIQYCFPAINSSCFKKLHTPTNMLILSMAVADLLIGLIVVPIEGIKQIDTCWYFGDTYCGLFVIIVRLLLSISLSNLVLIAVDRYVAVCYSLLYPQKITMTKTLISIFSVRRKSESKAALTLGIIVTAYLLCWIPFYICSLTKSTAISSTTMTFLLWTFHVNSGLNPIVYALFYRWFKISVKHILTLRIFQPTSSLMDIYTDYHS
ncbi:trace amine-associated receptor 13c-like [Pseudorasbora parva]|uniref:trace amine-associated receptor 13c-like n=1 Tax=Pseudorasbora parva TaxID=51549 RepID=UPI00351DBBA9